MTKRYLLVFISAATLMVSTEVSGQSTFAPGRVLQKATLRTEVSSLALSITPRNLFPPTVVTCSGSGTCTLHIEVSTDIAGVSVGNSAFMRVLVDGVSAQPGSVGVLQYQAGRNTRTFQWIRPGLAPGNHTVQTVIWVTADSGQVITRTQKINIYKP